MWFGSWTHDNLEFNLTMPKEGGLDLKTFQADFKEISEWEISSTGKCESSQRVYHIWV